MKTVKIRVQDVDDRYAMLKILCKNGYKVWQESEGFDQDEKWYICFEDTKDDK